MKQENSVVEISLIFIFAYVSYLIPESLQASGIMGLFAFIIVINNYGSKSMNNTTNMVNNLSSLTPLNSPSSFQFPKFPPKNFSQGSRPHSPHLKLHRGSLRLHLPGNLIIQRNNGPNRPKTRTPRFQHNLHNPSPNRPNDRQIHLSRVTNPLNNP